LEYDEFDLQPLAVQPSLEDIRLKGAPRLESLYGIDQFELTRLHVALARELEDIDALAHARGSLHEVDFETCLGLYDIESLGQLVWLRFLGISDCGRIRSLVPLANLTQLESLDAWGSTRVEDDDLSALLRLPQLKEVRMRDRTTYRPRVKEVLDRLTGRSPGEGSGGGGNRTRVRGRTGKSLYKLVLRFEFASRPVRRRPTD